MAQTIAIIGAGLSGLVLAKKLQSHAQVTVFEKSRGVGGRLATRYADPYQFDHGAQFFTAESEAFQQFLSPLVTQGVLGHWPARFVELERDKVLSQRQWGKEWPHYIGLPKMNAIGKYLAQGLDVKLQTRVESLKKPSASWELLDENGQSLGCYDWVISTAPIPQTQVLMPECFSHSDALKASRVVGCFALMLGYAEPVPLPWDAALVKDADISWISVNSSKPGRPTGFSLVVLATNQWAEANMEADQDSIIQHLREEASAVAGLDLQHSNHVALHRWRYANSNKHKGDAYLLDTENHLAVCGDGCIQGIAEAAFTSASKLAESLIPHLDSSSQAVA